MQSVRENRLAQIGRDLAKSDPLVGVVRALVPSEERREFDITNGGPGFHGQNTLGEAMALALSAGRKRPSPPQLTSTKTLAGYFTVAGATAEHRANVWRRLRRDGAVWVGAKVAIDRLGRDSVVVPMPLLSNDCGTAIESMASFGGELRDPSRMGVFGRMFGSELGYGGFASFGGSPYGDSLAKVGLRPDNPDGMFNALMSFLHNPAAFKNADKNWRGARDNLSWWEEPKGVARLIWPFHGGKWLTEGPRNEAQIRAVFKIPAGKGTKQGLSELYHFPFTSNLSYRLVLEEWKGDGGGFDLGKSIGDAWSGVQQGINTVVDVANDFNIPGVNLTTAILTGKNPIDALKADIDHFKSAAGIAAAVASGDTGKLTAGLNASAAKFGIHLDPAAVSAAVSVAQNGGDPSTVATAAMGDGYTKAWQLATNGGTIYDAALPTPPGQSYKPGAKPAATVEHPLTTATKKSIPLHLAVAEKPIVVPHDQTAVSVRATISKWWPTALGIAVGGSLGALKAAAWTVSGALAGGFGGHWLGEHRKGKK